jgi:hypothetical protein
MLVVLGVIAGVTTRIRAVCSHIQYVAGCRNLYVDHEAHSPSTDALDATSAHQLPRVSAVVLSHAAPQTQI